MVSAPARLMMDSSVAKKPVATTSKIEKSRSETHLLLEPQTLLEASAVLSTRRPGQTQWETTALSSKLLSFTVPHAPHSDSSNPPTRHAGSGTPPSFSFSGCCYSGVKVSLGLFGS